MSEEKKAVSVRADTKTITTVQANSGADIGIRGLEGTPMSALPIPMVKLIHPTTTGAVNAKGEKVPPGKFLNVQSCKVYDKVSFYIIRSKPGQAKFIDKKTEQPVYKEAFFLLGADTENKKIFSMTLTGSSFWNFRNLLGQIKGSDLKDVWGMSIVASPEDKEGKFGAYMAIQFMLGSETPKEDLKELEELYVQYSSALDKAPTPAVEEGDDIPF